MDPLALATAIPRAIMPSRRPAARAPGKLEIAPDQAPWALVARHSIGGGGARNWLGPVAKPRLRNRIPAAGLDFEPLRSNRRGSTRGSGRDSRTHRLFTIDGGNKKRLLVPPTPSCPSPYRRCIYLTRRWEKEQTGPSSRRILEHRRLHASERCRLGRARL